jgi:hypothetical protein
MRPWDLKGRVLDMPQPTLLFVIPEQTLEAAKKIAGNIGSGSRHSAGEGL